MLHPVHHEIVEICKITRVKCSWRQAYLDDANTGEIVYSLCRNLFKKKRTAFESVLTEKLKRSRKVLFEYV